MTYVNTLKETVRAEAATGRIGRPVFLRLSARTALDQNALRPALAEALSMTEACLSAVPEQLYALGGFESGEVTVVVKCAGGQSAIVSVGLARSGPPQIDLMLVGSRGAIYHGDSPDQSFGQHEVPPGAENLTDAVERSLETGRPTSLEEGGK